MPSCRFSTCAASPPAISDAPNLSPGVISRLTAGWEKEYERWRGRDLSARRYVYVWADGVYFSPRLEHERQCVLVLIGADASGKKELLAIDDGFRESEQSWHELLIRLRDENGQLTKKMRHICWDGCMFPNAVMEKQQTWNDVLGAMVKVREAHGWRE